MQTRRDFLVLAGAAAAAAVVLPLAGLGRRLAGTASAAPGERVLDRFRYRGRAIEIRERAGAGILALDGREMPEHVFTRLPRRDGDVFASHLLPFTEERDPRRLARELVDGDALELFVL